MKPYRASRGATRDVALLALIWILGSTAANAESLTELLGPSSAFAHPNPGENFVQARYAYRLK
jgi:hypothetical protein